MASRFFTSDATENRAALQVVREVSRVGVARGWVRGCGRAAPIHYIDRGWTRAVAFVP
jgi:hypothetical protein